MSKRQLESELKRIEREIHKADKVNTTTMRRYNRADAKLRKQFTKQNGKEKAQLAQLWRKAQKIAKRIDKLNGR